MKRSWVVLTFLLVVLFSFSLVLGPTGKALSADKVTRIKIAGGRVRNSWYAFSQALSSFINKKSKWLRAETVATAGLSADIELIRQKPKEYIGMAPLSTTLQFRPGRPYAKARKPYAGGRFIANITTMTQLLMTYNPHLKSVEDLKGKRVDVGRMGAGNTPDDLAILKAYGILDNVKLLYTGFGGGAKRMIDGFCDATFLIISHTYPHQFRKGPFVEKMESRKPVYYIGFSHDILLKLCEEGHATIPVMIPAGTLDPKTQPKALWAFNDPVFLMADVHMDPKIVEEVTKIIFETPASEWAKWNPQGKGMTPEFDAACPSPEFLPPHPGAKAYYEKHGIKISNLADLLKK